MAAGILCLVATPGLRAQEVVTVPCDGDTVVGTYCYVDNDDHSWLWISDCGAPIFLHFISGMIESNAFDQVVIYDGSENTAPVLYQNGSNPATVDLAGVQAVGTSGYLFMQMTSNPTTCCATEGLLPTDGQWQWTWVVNDGTVGIAEAPRNGFTLFPNPATEEMTIRPAATMQGTTQVEILDALGRMVLQGQFTPAANAEESVDLRGLRIGTYTVMLSTPGGKQERHLLVIQ